MPDQSNCMLFNRMRHLQPALLALWPAWVSIQGTTSFAVGIRAGFTKSIAITIAGRAIWQTCFQPDPKRFSGPFGSIPDREFGDHCHAGQHQSAAQGSTVKCGFCCADKFDTQFVQIGNKFQQTCAIAKTMVSAVHHHIIRLTGADQSHHILEFVPLGVFSQTCSGL